MSQWTEFPGDPVCILSNEDLYEPGKDIRQYQEQYRALPMSGADCLECGACLEWCEYKLNIPKLLKEAEETLRFKKKSP